MEALCELAAILFFSVIDIIVFIGVKPAWGEGVGGWGTVQREQGGGYSADVGSLKCSVDSLGTLEALQM